MSDNEIVIEHTKSLPGHVYDGTTRPMKGPYPLTFSLLYMSLDRLVKRGELLMIDELSGYPTHTWILNHRHNTDNINDT